MEIGNSQEWRKNLTVEAVSLVGYFFNFGSKVKTVEETVN